MNTPRTANSDSQVPSRNTMRAGLRGAAAGVVLLVAQVTFVQAAEAVNHELEACINGGVSASGNYASEAEEMHARASLDTHNSRSLALEPCINGEVSETGAFPTQALEDQFGVDLALEPCINGAVSPTGVFPTQTLGQETFAVSR